MIVGIVTEKHRQNSRSFPDDIFWCVLLNENAWIWIKISLNFVHKGLINITPALVGSDNGLAPNRKTIILDIKQWKKGFIISLFLHVKQFSVTSLLYVTWLHLIIDNLPTINRVLRELCLFFVCFRVYAELHHLSLWPFRLSVKW